MGNNSLLVSGTVQDSPEADHIIGSFPASFAQQRLWFLNQLDPSDVSYNRPYAYRLNGPMNTDAFQRSLDAVVARQESLRTIFEMRKGVLYQLICRADALPISHVDLQECPFAERETTLLQMAHTEARRPFDLTSGPLLRATLYRLAEQEHVLLLTLHHICTDGWSMGILFHELAAQYTAIVQSEPCALTELPIQYADYAVWQRDKLQGDFLETQLAYWRMQLQGAPDELDLPVREHRLTSNSDRGANYEFTLLPALVKNVKALGRKQGCTFFMLMLAAFQTMLYRYTHQDDFVVGTAIANRTRVETEKLIGLFTNTLALRAQFHDDESFLMLLARTRDVCLNAYANQDLPFEQVIDSLNLKRELRVNPLFQVMFVLENAPEQTWTLPGLLVQEVSVHTGSAMFSLTLRLTESAHALMGEIEYNTDIFTADAIQRMAGHFQRLLEGIVANPEQKIAELPLLTAEEQKQILGEWNNTDLALSDDKCFHELFEAQAERTPDRLAVVSGDASLTYRELNQRANQLAHYLLRKGVGTESLVGICVERSLDTVIGIMGILKAGAAYVPADSDYPAQRVAQIMTEARVNVLLTQSHLVRDAVKSGADAYQVVSLDTAMAAIAEESVENPRCHVLLNNLAYVIFTSGSQGKPKGVMVEHHSVLNLLAGLEHAIYNAHASSQYRVSLNASITFDASVQQLITLLRGHTLCIIPQQIRMDGEALIAYVQSQRLDVLDCVPSQLKMLVAAGMLDSNNWKPRIVLVGGEAIDDTLWQSLSSAGDIEFFNLYGPTECTVDTTICRVRSDLPPSIGRPIVNTQHYVLDRNKQPVPVGIHGELYIGGAGVSRGYHQQPQQTSERFIPNPFSAIPEDRLYRTGDSVRWLPDGNLEYLGRLDNQVKLRGYRIELGEIESVLIQHPTVRNAVVAVQEDEPGDKRLIAYLVAKPNHKIEWDALRTYLQQKLPYYMVPAHCMLLDAIPLSSNGKVDRRKLPALTREPRNPADSFIPVGNPTEERLAQIWADVLRIDVSHLGIHDNFFELGGHSLLANRVIARICQTFQVDLPLRSIFEEPTIAGLASRLQVAPASTFTTRQTQATQLDLSLSQQGMWFLGQLDPEAATYNTVMAHRLSGSLDVKALERSLEMLVHRHAMLRSVYLAHDGMPYTVITPPQPFRLQLVDLSGEVDAEREGRMLQLANEEVKRPFDLSSGPLLRAQLLRLSDQSHVFIMTAHHIVVDEWSIEILNKELNALYAALTEKREPNLPALQFQYADFTEWQNQLLTSGVIQSQLQYWRDLLHDVPVQLDIPTDHPYPPVQTYRGNDVSFTLAPDLTAGLKELSLRYGCTLFMTLLAACEVLLSKYSGQSQFIIGTPITNRDRIEFENVIGYFLNTLALRADLSGDPVFVDLLAHIRDTSLDAFANRESPLDRLVAQMPIPHDLSRPPLIQTAFVMQEKIKEPLCLQGLITTPFVVDTMTAKFELTLFIRHVGNELVGGIEYNSDLFDAATIQRMAGHYQQLLAEVLSNPARRISALPLLTTEEQTLVLSEWNDTDTVYPDNQCIHALFAAQARLTPDAVAVVFANQSLTYRELDQRANQLAQHLSQLGIGPEVVVGVCIERSLEMIIGLLGVLKAGGAYLPLDPTYPSERLSFMLADAHVPLVLTRTALLAKLGIGSFRAICLDTEWDVIAQASTQPVPNSASADSLAYVIYTSGSTGLPKGVSCLHRGVVRLVKGAHYASFSAEEVFLQMSPISFDAATFEIWGSLLNGARLVIYPAHTPSLHELDQLIHEHAVTTLWLTAGLFHLAVDEQLTGLRTLHQLLAGGDMLSESHVRKFLEDAPDCHLINGYGPTEATTFTTTCLLDKSILSGGGVAIGRPISNTRVYVLDEHLQPVPIGVPGELYIGGAGVARGYLNRPELTAERFIIDPFSNIPGAHLYRSGDLASWRSDGNLNFLGRLDDQVKIRGFRIELGEVESVLAQHPAVRDVVVVAKTHNSAEKRLIAYLTLHQHVHVATGELREFLMTKVPDYMVPAIYMVLDSLPLTPNGKVDRKALPSPSAIQQDSAVAVVHENTNMVEVVLTSMWAQLLGLKHVDIHGNFFELGGNSLLAIQLFNRIEDVFSKHLPLTLLFQFPTISQLADAIIAGGLSEEWSTLVAIQAPGAAQKTTPGSPFFCVHGFGGGVLGYARLAHRLGETQSFYGLQAIGLDGIAEPDADIKVMAARYIRAMRSVQPHGPYHIGGYCFGAYVAYEMACQLHTQGERAALVALIEGYAPTIGKLQPSELRWKRLATLWRNVPFWLHDYLQLGWGGIQRRINQQIEKGTNTLRQALHIDAATDPLQRISGEVSQLPSWQRKIMEIHIRALSNYIPTPYHGRVTLFRAQHRTIRQALFGTEDPELGWGQLAAGGVDVRQCPGSHRNLHMEPYVAGLAQQLRACIDEVNALNNA